MDFPLQSPSAKNIGLLFPHFPEGFPSKRSRISAFLTFPPVLCWWEYAPSKWSQEVGLTLPVSSAMWNGRSTLGVACENSEDLVALPQVWRSGSIPRKVSQNHACCCCSCLVTQSCPTLCDPVHYRPSGSSSHGISQARILDWLAIPFLCISSWPRD